MVFKDAKTNELREGDVVGFGLGLGNVILARIQKLESGLGLDGTPQAQPVAILEAVFPVGALPNGVIPGIFKTADLEVPKLADTKRSAYLP